MTRPSEVMVATWSCFTCEAGATGDPAVMNRAAERHTNSTQHGTHCETRLVKPPKVKEGSSHPMQLRGEDHPHQEGGSQEGEPQEGEPEADQSKRG